MGTKGNSRLKVELGTSCNLTFKSMDEVFEASKKLSQYDKIIKLNEELTAENDRLINDADALNEHIGTCNEMYDNSIKENLEITEANTRLTLQVEHLSNERDKFKTCFSEVNKKCMDYKVANEELQYENASIKSKWWYKLMTWVWK